RYDGSPLIVADGTEPPPDDPALYRPSACPGGRAPHFWLPDGSSLFDRLGPWFTLLCFREPRLVSDTGMPLSVLALDVPEARELLVVVSGVGGDHPGPAGALDHGHLLAGRVTADPDRLDPGADRLRAVEAPHASLPLRAHEEGDVVGLDVGGEVDTSSLRPRP